MTTDFAKVARSHRQHLLAAEVPQANEAWRIIRTEFLNLCENDEDAATHFWQEHMMLNEVDLSGKSLTGIDLRDSSLCQANLNGTDLTNAKLGRAHLKDVTINGANLNGADLRGANIEDLDLLQAASMEGTLITLPY